MIKDIDLDQLMVLDFLQYISVEEGLEIESAVLGADDSHYIIYFTGDNDTIGARVRSIIVPQCVRFFRVPHRDALYIQYNNGIYGKEKENGSWIKLVTL